MSKQLVGVMAMALIVFSGCVNSKSSGVNIDDTGCTVNGLTSNSSRVSASANCTVPSPIKNYGGSTGSSGSTGTSGSSGSSGGNAPINTTNARLPNSGRTPADLLGSLSSLSNFGWGRGRNPSVFGDINKPEFLADFLASPTFGPMVRALFGNNIPPAAEAVEELQNAIEAGKFFPPKIRLRLLAVGSQTSGLVKIYRIIESRQPVEIANFYAFDSQAVSVAIGDVTGDGIADVVVGGNSEVRIFRGAMSGESGLSFAISGFFAPYPGFAGGVNVATGDFNGDGKIDIITGAGAGGGPHVKVFDGATDFNTTTHSFFAYDQAFRGGVYVALGDFNGDHHAELVTSPGPGGGPHVKTWRGVGTTGTPVQYENYMAYDEAFRGGVSIACADMDNDGRTDLVTGALKGGGPHAKFFSGRTDNVIMSQFVYPEEMKAGIAVAAGYIFGERSPAFVVGPATASNNSVILYSWQAGQNLKEEARLSPFPGEGVSLAIGVSF